MRVTRGARRLRPRMAPAFGSLGMSTEPSTISEYVPLFVRLPGCRLVRFIRQFVTPRDHGQSSHSLFVRCRFLHLLALALHRVRPPPSCVVVAAGPRARRRSISPGGGVPSVLCVSPAVLDAKVEERTAQRRTREGRKSAESFEPHLLQPSVCFPDYSTSDHVPRAQYSTSLDPSPWPRVRSNAAFYSSLNATSLNAIRSMRAVLRQAARS